jgi:pilus assembly protein Flp/PilA
LVRTVVVIPDMSRRIKEPQCERTILLRLNPVVTLLTENSMKKLTTAVRSFIREDDGAALVEYAILVALIAVVAIFFVTSLGTKVSQKVRGIAGSL